MPQEKDEKKKYRYTILNSQGEKVKGYLDSHSYDEAKNYLLSQQYQIVSLKEVNAFLTVSIGGSRFKNSEISFILTQLSTYLKAGIPLMDAVKILEKQSVKSEQRRTFSNIAYQLSRGDSFSEAMESEKRAFPTLLINMMKASEATGDLETTLDEMADYYSSIDKTRKETVNAMIYPILIFVFAIAVMAFILVYIIPEFVSLFEQNNAELPHLTKFVIGASSFVTNNALPIAIVLVLIILTYTLLYRKVKPFRKGMQTIFLHLPLVGNAIIYKEVALFTKTFSYLLARNVFITDSMEMLSNITTNEVYKDIIRNSLGYLAKGGKISESFKGKKEFPVVAYEMLQTGENTGRLATMMEYVGKYYDNLHTNLIKRVNTFIEPVMILLLAVMVGVVVLSLIIPMFSFYSTI